MGGRREPGHASGHACGSGVVFARGGRGRQPARAARMDNLPLGPALHPRGSPAAVPIASTDLTSGPLRVQDMSQSWHTKPQEGPQHPSSHHDLHPQTSALPQQPQRHRGDLPAGRQRAGKPSALPAWHDAPAGLLCTAGLLHTPAHPGRSRSTHIPPPTRELHPGHCRCPQHREHTLSPANAGFRARWVQVPGAGSGTAGDRELYLP